VKRSARPLSIVPAAMAAALLAIVVITGVNTVMKLRSVGHTEWPLVALINALPAGLIVFAVWAFARGRDVIAATLGLLALAIASIFWLSQSSGASG